MASTSVDFSKKCIVFVTGASRGIGRTIAVELSRRLQQNSIFVLIARSEKGLEETKNLIQEVDKALNVQTIALDLSKPNLVEYTNIFNKVLSSIDKDDIYSALFFHNAGSIGEAKQTTDLIDLQKWSDYYHFNLFSVALLNSTFIKLLRPVAPQLVVVNITSLAGRQPFVNLSMYGSGKAARELFFKALAIEEPNVIVFNYSPGPVDTDMFTTIIEEAQSEEVRNNFKKTKETSILTTSQTVNKMLEILEKGDFKSGDTIDYYDRI
ncbi:unnamed protein product [Callosobruchus maculatus]|uniref:Sepiapterin reductase n=1 Tax=Callosobruchus maculatus TaxID=64391 RepID=A0A653DUD1_CALMS|nr:unnamed protein product [Callosobruchus maculatus]